MPDSRRPDDYDPDRWDAVFIEARDGPRDLEEGCHRRTLASLNNGWLARGGLLRLHDDSLSFSPALQRPMRRPTASRDIFRHHRTGAVLLARYAENTRMTRLEDVHFAPIAQ